MVTKRDPLSHRLSEPDGEEGLGLPQALFEELTWYPKRRSCRKLGVQTIPNAEDSEVISLSTFLSIKALFEEGHPKKSIARRLGIDPRTVRKHIRRIEAGAEVPESSPRASKLSQYRSVIEERVNAGCTAVQIYSHLCEENPGFEASYETVKRLVRKLRPGSAPVAYCRMRYAPAEEAQVDFGEVQRMLVNGKRRRVWLFAMTLCFSRRTYYELVLDQKVPTFLSAIRHGFEAFGGVPHSIKPDNLKSAVLISALGERAYQKDFYAFCRHYGTLPNAARPFTPTDKGRVERDIRYAKTSFFQGRPLEAFATEQAGLAKWMDGTANRRVHGTTRRRPIDLFEEERSALLPLPQEAFELASFGHYRVRKDCHIQVLGNYYSVPHAHVGTKVCVRVTEGEITAFANDSVVAVHPRLREKGGSQTDNAHYPQTKQVASREVHRLRVEQVRSAGPQTSQFLSRLKEGPMVFRDQLLRMSRLVEAYGSAAVESACERALHFEAVNSSLRLERILKRGLHLKPLPQSHPSKRSWDHDYGRPLSEYGDILSWRTPQ